MFKQVLIGLIVVVIVPCSYSDHHDESALVLETYAKLVHANYTACYETALVLQTAVTAFLEQPNEHTLTAAKQAWLDSRIPYGQSEAFRFYEGPIDGAEGPEERLNSWPLNEAYIDYVKGHPHAGIIADLASPLTEAAIVQKNQADDEADVSTGYHALEFLLWGQDLSLTGPGSRPVSDYIGDHPTTVRRRAYLRIVTDLLIKDLKFLVDSWADEKGNYADRFKQLPHQDAFSKILTGLATLSGFELASERMGVPLDSGDQEDEHSCFSDNTHNDLIYNARGIRNVYLGTYADFQGQGLNSLVAKLDPALNQRILKQLDTTQNAVEAIDAPIDRAVLATKANSPARQKMEAAIRSLQVQAELFKTLGNTLGANVEVIRE